MPGPRPRKVRITHWLDRWLVNPVVRTMVRVHLAPRAVALLETRGHRTGQARVVPVLNGLDEDRFWVFAQDGMWCAYMVNALAHPDVRVRVKGQPWRAGRAHVGEAAGPAPDRRRIGEELGIVGRIEARIFAAVSTEVVPMRVDLEPQP